MATLATAPRPRPKAPVGQSVPAGRDDWTLAHLRGRPLPDAEAIVYVLAYARQRKLFVDGAKDVVEANDIRHRIERAQLRASGKRGLTPLYWVYAECHPSEASAQLRCAEIKAPQAAGYEVEIRVVAAHELECRVGIDQRFTKDMDRKDRVRDHTPPAYRAIVTGR